MANEDVGQRRVTQPAPAAPRAAPRDTGVADRSARDMGPTHRQLQWGNARPHEQSTLPSLGTMLPYPSIHNLNLWMRSGAGRSWLQANYEGLGPLFALHPNFAAATIEWNYRNGPSDFNGLVNRLAQIGEGLGIDIYSVGPKVPGGGPGRSRGGGGGISAADKAAAVDSIYAELWDLARTYGITNADDAGLRTLAEVALEKNFTSRQLNDALMMFYDVEQLDESGTLRAMSDTVKQLASDYLMPVSNETAARYAERVHRGELTQEGIANVFREQARSQWSWMSESIDQGVTVRDFLSPLRDQIARTLEMAPDDVDMMDPKWQSMMQTRTEDGVVRAATLSEASAQARRDVAYTTTRGAAMSAAQMSGLLMEVFGGRVVG